MQDKTNNPVFIDATGLNCPVPLMLLKQAVDGAVSGAHIHVSVTDIHAELDFEIWCERFGHQLKPLKNEGEVLKFLVITAPLTENQ